MKGLQSLSTAVAVFAALVSAADVDPVVAKVQIYAHICPQRMLIIWIRVGIEILLQN